MASIVTTDSGTASDVNSVKAEWRDQNGLLLETLTRTTVDVSGTDIYGNASTITDPAGTGTYQATLVIDLNNYAPSTSGLQWSVTLTIVKGSKTFTQIFYFTVVATTLSISLDTTSISVAVMRQTNIVEDVVYMAQGSTTFVSLRSGPVYAILAAYKNGVVITNPTDYSWKTYQTNVTLAAVPTVNDHFVFAIQKQSDNFVLDIVNRVIADTLRALRPHYASDSLMTSPSVIEIVKALCIGQFKQDMAQGTALDSAFYRSGFDLQKEARLAILRIQRGAEDIYDSSGNVIARKTGSLVGGYRHPDGDFTNRLGLLDRAQQHTGLFLKLYPDPIINQTRFSRGVTTP